MNSLKDIFWATWKQSTWFRVALIAATIWAGLRLILQGVYLTGAFTPQAASKQTTFVPNDLQNFIDAAERLQRQQPLYQLGPIDNIDVLYQYSPVYIWMYTSFLKVPPLLLVLLHTLLNIVAYVCLYGVWTRIFSRLGRKTAWRWMVRMLPLWLVFSAFWSDLGLLNIYTFVALLSSLLLLAVIEEKSGWALLWLTPILQTKPHWAFALAVPLLLGRWRFFSKLLVGSVVIYVALAGITLVAVGPAYGWQQYQDYYRFLLNLSQNFPWRGPGAGFLGYNHSVVQIVVYLLGVSPATLQLATALKLLLLVPLVVVGARYLYRMRRARRDGAEHLLDLALLCYLGAFIWLDMVWEVTLGIAVFTWLLATNIGRWERAILWLVFLPYALLDAWQMISYLIFGESIFYNEAYLLTDPSIYVPLVMLVILVLYALLLKRLWLAVTPSAAVTMDSNT